MHFTHWIGCKQSYRLLDAPAAAAPRFGFREVLRGK